MEVPKTTCQTIFLCISQTGVIGRISQAFALQTSAQDKYNYKLWVLLYGGLDRQWDRITNNLVNFSIWSWKLLVSSTSFRKRKVVFFYLYRDKLIHDIWVTLHCGVFWILSVHWIISPNLNKINSMPILTMFLFIVGWKWSVLPAWR